MASDDMKLRSKPGKHVPGTPARPEQKTEYPKAVNGWLCHNLNEEESVRAGEPLPGCRSLKPNFAQSKPVPTGTPVEIQLKTQLAEVRSDLAAERKRNAELIAEIARLKARAEPSVEATRQPVNALSDAGGEGGANAGQSAPAASDASDIEIPEKWMEMQPETKKALARQISGEDVTRKDVAEKIIAAELKRRDNA